MRRKATIEETLRALSSYAMNRPVFWVAAFVLLTVIWTLGIGRLRMRTEGSSVYPTGNEVILQSEKDQRIFQDSQELILLVTTQDPGANSLASPDGLLFLKRIHESLEGLAGLHPTGVLSLARIPNGLPEDISQPFPTLLDSISTNSSAFEALLKEIRDDPVAHGLFLSPDGDAAAFYVNFAVDQAPDQIILTLQSWIDSQEKSGHDLHLLGPLAAETTLGDMVVQDLTRLIPIMVALIAILLLLFLRTPGGVLVSMVEVVMVLIWIFGAMGYCGVPVTLVTTVLPVVLMAMGITDQIHLLERLQAHLATTGPPEPTRSAAQARFKEVMLASLREVGWPIIATSLTTALAFLSFLSASMSPVRQFGLFASLGILLAMFLTFTFIPALAVLLPVSWFVPRKRKISSDGFRTLFFWEKSAARQRSRTWLVGLLLLVFGLPGFGRLSVQDSWVGNFDPNSPLPVADRRFNQAFWGSYRYDVVFKGKKRFFYQPEGIGLMEKFTRLAEGGPHVGGILSHLVPLEQVADEYGFPTPISSLSEVKIRQLGGGARFAVGAPFMRLLVTTDGSSARTRIFVNRANYQRGLELEEYLETRLHRLVDGNDVDYHMSGDLPAAVEVVRAVVTNQLRSIGWTLLGIAVLLLLAFRTIREAIIVLLPVLAADWILFAGLGYAGVPLGIATSMFASLTIGVGIDYALHLRHSYRQNTATEPDHTSALVKALGSTGRAIRWNAFALGIGFLVLGFSSIPPNRALGILLSSAMFTCYGTTLLLLPRLLHPTSPPGSAQRSS
jgi:predicted RND superfamily exporter protein